MADLRRELAALFGELAELTALRERDPQSFRVRAYDKARTSIRALPADFETMTVAELSKLSGIGRGSASKIREYLDTDRIAKLEELRGEFPPEVVELARLPGIGPKSLSRLRSELGVQSVADLRAAVENRTLRTLTGFGARSEERIRLGIERLGLGGAERRVAIADALPIGRRIVEDLVELPETSSALFCGSLRRLRETIGDVDVVVATRNPERVAERFLSRPWVREVLVRGGTRCSIVTREGMQVDLRMVLPEQLGAATLYFTGSKAHNIKLRQRALEQGRTLNEYALSDAKTGEVVASGTEEEIYGALGLEPVPPPMREDTGEVELAAEAALPPFLRPDDLCGDLHVHTSLSGDGRSTLEEVVAEAAVRGYRYVAITDHAEDLPRIGVTRAAIQKQRDRVRRLSDAHPGLQILHGCELNIDPSGGLDWDPEFRAGFDWCIAAVHSHFDLDQARQTKRILRAMEDHTVHVIGHISSRLIGRRPGMALDYDAILEMAAETGCAIEINSALRRLDVAADVLRRARDLPVTFVVSSDAHHVDELSQLRWGALQSQRGWVDPARVANAWPYRRFAEWTARRRPS